MAKNTTGSFLQIILKTQRKELDRYTDGSRVYKALLYILVTELRNACNRVCRRAGNCEKMCYQYCKAETAISL